MIEKKIIEDIEKYIEGINKKNDNCDWQIKKNGDEPVVLIIGEEHCLADKVDSEEWNLQRFIFEEIKPKYIVNERGEERIKQQMNGLKIEDVRFSEPIGSDEKKQGKRIKECLSRFEIPVLALIGHTHAREDSEIHEYNKNNNIKYICTWNTNKVKKKEIRDKEKEEEGRIKKFGFGGWTEES